MLGGVEIGSSNAVYPALLQGLGVDRRSGSLNQKCLWLLIYLAMVALYHYHLHYCYILRLYVILCVYIYTHIMLYTESQEKPKASLLQRTAPALVWPTSDGPSGCSMPLILDLVAERIHFTLFGIILPTIKLKVHTSPTIKLKVYTSWGL